MNNQQPPQWQGHHQQGHEQQYGPSAYGPPPQGYAAPAGYGPPPPAPKKGMGLLAKFAVGCLVLFGGCATLGAIGSAGRSAHASAATAQPASATAPTADDSSRAAAPVRVAVKPTAAPSPVNIGSMLGEYKDNEVRADGEYKGRFVTTTGVVSSVTKGPFGGMYVRLGTGKEFEVNELNCMLDDDQASQAAQLSKGAKATVQGTVQGLSMLDVGLRHCTIAAQ